MALSNTVVTGTVKLDGSPHTATWTATPVDLGSAPGGQLVPTAKSGTASGGALTANLDRAVTADTWMPINGVRYLIVVTIGSLTWETFVVIRSWTETVDLGDIDLVTPFTYLKDSEGLKVSENLSDLSDVQEARTALGWLTDAPLASGESNMSRTGLVTTANAITSGVVYLQYFTAKKTETVGRIRIPSGGTAAGATPTLIKLAVYEENPANGNLTLKAVTASDTSLFAGTTTEYAKNTTATFEKVAGRRYATGLLVVSGQTMPAFLAPIHPNASSAVATILGRSPRILGQLTGQTDIPESIAAGDITSPNSVRAYYAEVVPAA